MHFGDITTKAIKKPDGGSYLLIVELDWLEYVGFTVKELESGEINIVLKADKSEKHGHNYIGFGKRR